MKFYPIGFLGAVFLFTGCFEGPAGEDGRDAADFTYFNGVVSDWPYNSSTGSWDISFFATTTKWCDVDFRARKNSSSMWITPEYYVSYGSSISYIRVFASQSSLDGYEYRIVVECPSDAPSN